MLASLKISRSIRESLIIIDFKWCKFLRQVYLWNFELKLLKFQLSDEKVFQKNNNVLQVVLNKNSFMIKTKECL